MERDIKDWGGNVVALVAVVLTNALANGLPLGGRTTGEVSGMYETLFTPAGYAFSIWGLIYVALLGYVIYQARPVRRQNVRLANISRPWQISCALNVLWVFLWHFDLVVLSMLAMLGILVCLLAIYRELGIATAPASLGRQVFVHLPFSIYTGWIIVASIANLSVVQVATGLEGWLFDPVSWTLIKLGVAGAAGAALVCLRRDIPAALVVVWAAWAIAVRQVDTPAVAGAAQAVAYAALVLVLYEAQRRLRLRD